MKCNHHQLSFELEDSWLEISNMKLFKPKQLHYNYANQIDDREVYIVDITDIAPCIQRSILKGVFCDKNTQLSGKERVVSILKGFRDNSRMQPIEIKYFDGVGDYKF